MLFHIHVFTFTFTYRTRSYYATAWLCHGRHCNSIHSITHAKLYSLPMHIHNTYTQTCEQKKKLITSTCMRNRNSKRNRKEQVTFQNRLTEPHSHELLSHHIKILHVYLRFTNDTSLNAEWISSIKQLYFFFCCCSIELLNLCSHSHSISAPSLAIYLSLVTLVDRIVTFVLIPNS